MGRRRFSSIADSFGNAHACSQALRNTIFEFLDGRVAIVGRQGRLRSEDQGALGWSKQIVQKHAQRLPSSRSPRKSNGRRLCRGGHAVRDVSLNHLKLELQQRLPILLLWGFERDKTTAKEVSVGQLGARRTMGDGCHASGILKRSRLRCH